MNKIIPFLLTLGLSIPLRAAELAAPQLPPIDAGAILAQINQQNNIPQPVLSPDLQFALEAASSLRRDLKDQGVKAKVGLLNEPGGRYGLWVEFKSWADYEKIKDLFYQDPGENPSYMDLKVHPRVGKDAAKAAKPITDHVSLKSPAFAELLVNSLNVKPKLVTMAGGQSYVYAVGAGLTCYKSFATDIHTPNADHKPRYSCLISPAGGWKAMGMESYGSGDNREFSKALYAALNVKEKNDEGMKTKGIELERPDGDGGTERNQLYCINPDPKMEGMGFRPTCQLINAL